MAVLPLGSWPAGGGCHLQCYSATILLLLLLPQPTEAQCRLGSTPRGRYPLGMNISFACPHVSTREPPKGTFNSTVSTSIPDPVFTWILKPLHSGGLGQPIREVLESNLWYSDPTHRVMYTVLLTREHLGTYTCECSRNCPMGKSSQHTFTVSEIEEGLVVYTDNFQVLASTCSRQRTIRATAEEGTRLHCTSSFSSNGRRLSFGWCHRYRFSYGLICNNAYTTLTSTSVNLVDENELECSLRYIRGWRGYRDHYFFDYIYRIPIDIALREPPNLKFCQASATELHLMFDADAYQEKYGDANNVEVVVDISVPKQTSLITNLTTPYIGKLNDSKSEITVTYYSLTDGVKSKEKGIDLYNECGRPSALNLIACNTNSSECTANSTALYLRFEVYEGSNRTVLEIELANNTMYVVNLTNETEHCICGEVKKVVYYAVLSDGEQSVKSDWSKDECLPSMCSCQLCSSIVRQNRLEKAAAAAAALAPEGCVCQLA